MTFLDSGGAGVFKSDALGRVRVPRERREQLLREFATSGILVRRFAQFAGVNPVTFYSWMKKDRAHGPGPPVRNDKRRVSFMEAVFDCSPTVRAGAEAPLVVLLVPAYQETRPRLSGVKAGAELTPTEWLRLRSRGPCWEEAACLGANGLWLRGSA